MGRSQKLVPIIVGAVLGLASQARAQATSLNTCLSNSGHPPCYLEGGNVYLGCGRQFSSYLGDIAWFPLRYIGPIRIEVESVAFAATRFPLYVEIVPLDGVGGGPCENAPGFVIMAVNGGPFPCGGWQGQGPVDFSHGGLLDIGDLYALRIRIPGTPFRDFETPYLDCVRITPSTGAPIRAYDWGMIKGLYR